MGREREKAASGQGLITLAKAICASAIIMFLFSHITITNASGTFFEETVTIQRLGTASESGLGLVEYGYGGGLESVAFDLSFGSGLGGNQNAQAAFNRAANCWAEVLDDPVTVRLNLDYTSLGSGILGSASTTMLIGGYDLVRGLVVSNAGEINNAREEALLENLPVASEVSTYMPKGFGLDGRLMLSQANYHALGGDGFDGSDGSITFSSNFSWDFDSSDGIAPGTYDFEAVAAHEIGHVLGFVSRVDYVDWKLSQNQTDVVAMSVLDLFRFQTEDVLDVAFDFTETPRTLAPGGSHSFFQGDGSILMSTGQYYGDGRQGSHWKDNLGLGLMDPTLASGQLGYITENDLIAMDLIGWDVVPEPATLVLLGLGSVILRRKKYTA